jgi:hypothetical protein
VNCSKYGASNAVGDVKWVGIWKETDLNWVDVTYRNGEETTEEQVNLYFGISDIPSNISAGVSILDI